jgi:hypothetical protein
MRERKSALDSDRALPSQRPMVPFKATRLFHTLRSARRITVIANGSKPIQTMALYTMALYGLVWMASSLRSLAMTEDGSDNALPAQGAAIRAAATRRFSPSSTL